MGRSRLPIAVAAYVAVAATVVYGIMNPGVGGSDETIGIVILAMLALLHLIVGFVTAQWWAVLLPVLPILIAVPAGYPENTGGEPLPLWFDLALLAPFEAVAVAAGVAVGRFVGRRRAGATPQTAG